MLCAVLQQAMVGAYVYATYEVDAEAMAMSPSPLDEVIALRGQAESQAKHEGLYTHRSRDWISWKEVPFRARPH